MTRRQLLGVALLALALLTWGRVMLVDRLADQGYFGKYLLLAESLPKERLAEVSPAYLWLMVLLRGIGVHGIRTLQIIGVSLAALFAAIAAHRWAGPIAAVAAAVFILGSRAALVCATDLEPETLILLLDAIALAAMAHQRWFLAGLALGASATARPVALLAAIAIGAWLLTRGLREVARFAIAVALPVMLAVGANFLMTGEALLMDPGSVFYEGMNPTATGYAGVQPRIVLDIEAAANQPDYMHVAYRIVASRAERRPLDHKQANVWWTSKATAFMREYPLAALKLTMRKAVLALHSYDSWDLSTMQRKAALLGRWPIWIPFALMPALALIALFLRTRDAALPLLFAAAGSVTLVAFYVTARQRNAVLPALAVAAAIGLTEIVSRRRALLAALVITLTVAFSINGRLQREDMYGWNPAAGTEEQRAFDQALELERRGQWAQADAILAELQRRDYRPMRESRAVSSVAFHRVRAALHLPRDPRPQLAIAAREAPGEVHVLAMQTFLSGRYREADRRLRALHDPFSAGRALADAWADLGDVQRARKLADDVRSCIPEWRPVGGQAPSPVAPRP